MLAHVLANTVGQHAGGPDEHAPCSRRSAEVAGGFAEPAGALAAAAADNTARSDGAGKLTAIASAYRAYAVAHPHLYRLMNYRPLRRDLLPEGLEARAARPLAEAAGYDERFLPTPEPRCHAAFRPLKPQVGTLRGNLGMPRRHA